MSFEWKYYLDLALELIEKYEQEASHQTNNRLLQEARLRAAISRAYYAANRTACEFLNNENPSKPVRKEASHSDVTGRFKQSGNKKRQEVGWDLENLRDWRERADYQNVPIPNLLIQARFCTSLAKKILTVLDTLSPESRRPSIK
jgi:hypothetical protein